MATLLRKKLIKTLFSEYVKDVPKTKNLLNEDNLFLDHLAIIDLPSKDSGIHIMKKILEKLGFQYGGNGYLPEKNNDFIWMHDPDFTNQKPEEALPQIVLADFRLENFSQNSQNIISKHTSQLAEFDFEKLDNLLSQKNTDDEIITLVSNYLCNNTLYKPTAEEYIAIKQENDLTAWVLLFGRKINHFGFSVYQNNKFDNLKNFSAYISSKLSLPLNENGGLIKGSPKCGIEQSSTIGEKVYVTIENTIFEANNSFIELIWRHSIKANPLNYSDYFTGFIAQNANKVVESLLIKNNEI